MDTIIGPRILRCSDGHLFTASTGGRLLASVHFGPKRLLRCPVDHAWRLASNVDRSALTGAELEQAARHQF